MLFFLPAHEKVVRQRPQDSSVAFESFTPSSDLSAGFLLYAVYTTYDSIGSDGTEQFEVVDIFSDREAAANAARAAHKRAEPVMRSDGLPCRRFWDDWGNSLERMVVVEVVVEEAHRYREEFRGW